MSAAFETTFHLKPLNENAYNLIINFKEQSGASNKRKFTFKQQSSVEEGVILDVFTKNGKCQNSLLAQLFNQREVKEAKNSSIQAKKMNSSFSSTVAVFDLKTASQGYLPCLEQPIAQSESVVCEFFKQETFKGTNSKKAKEIYTIFKNQLPLDFIICEGSLKSDLLQHGGFSDREIEYLNSSSGSTSFCQLAEFFMNAFKLGQSSISSAVYEFNAQNYIKPIQTASFKPQRESQVFYSSLYQELYSPSGQFASTLKPIFSVSGNYFADTQITLLTVEKK